MKTDAERQRYIAELRAERVRLLELLRLCSRLTAEDYAVTVLPQPRSQEREPKRG